MDGLTAAYQSRLKRIRENTGHAVHQQWKVLGSYNEADVPRFVGRVTPIVRAGQTRAVALSAAYASRRLHRPTVGVPLDSLDLRNGTPPAVVYRRPFVDVWSKLKGGVTLENAIDFGGEQAQSSALMDIALAVMASYVMFTAFANSSDPDSDQVIVAWRRVADTDCCDFCLMLDGVHTGPDEPQPLHNRCGCTADPITRAMGAPSTTIGPGDVHDDVAIHEHGELGPVITQKGDHFTGPDEIPPASVDADELADDSAEAE